MDCKIIFYSARKTSLCERALKKGLSACGVGVGGSCFAAKPEALGALVEDAFKSCEMAAIVGGLEFGDSRNLARIMSRALSKSKINLSRRLRNDGGDDGFLIRSGNSVLLLLPDEPDQIKNITDGVLSDWLSSVCARRDV